MTDYQYFIIPDTNQIYRVSTEYDYDAESPREWEPITHMVTVDRDFHSPDGKKITLRSFDIPEGGPYVSYYGIDPDYMSKWLAIYSRHLDDPLIGYRWLKRESRDGTLADYEPVHSNNFHHWDGLIFMTRSDWDKAGFDSDITEVKVHELLQQDVENYNQWAQGYYHVISIDKVERWRHDENPDRTTHTWEYYAGLGGVNTYDEDDLTFQIEELLPALAVEINESELADLLDSDGEDN